MKMFKIFNKLISAMLIPFFLGSLLTVLSHLLILIADNLNGDIYVFAESLSFTSSALVPYVFCFFITQVMTKGKRGFKGFWSVICLAFLSKGADALGDNYFSLIFAFTAAFLCVYCFERLEAWQAAVLSVTASIIMGILFGYINDYFNSLIMWLGELIEGKGVLSGVLFSFFDMLFSLFDVSAFRDSFFTKSYSGALLFDGEMITGVKDLFSQGYDGRLVGTYLSGHYFTLFSVIGSALTLASKLKSTDKLLIITTALCAVLSGNIFLFLIFIFLQSPFLFISFIFINALAYISAYVLDISAGYLYEGSFFEMLIHSSGGIYLFSAGIVFVCIGYFVSKYVIEKHGITADINTYIPKKLKDTVENLGGIMNIVRFKNDTLEIRNPKLVNTLALECEIDENTVISKDERFLQLKDYI